MIKRVLMPTAILSPVSGGRRKTSRVNRALARHGMTMMTTWYKPFRRIFKTNATGEDTSNLLVEFSTTKENMKQYSRKLAKN